jgi:predicted enzyme related to lactoylglutathione lyase
MSNETKPETGAIGWTDLTVPDAGRIRDFYSSVVGWTHTGIDMGGYQDFCMNCPDTGRTVAGICHASGINTGIPPVWLVYIQVGDLAASLERVTSLGGAVLSGPREAGEGRMAVIRDPAGAVAALYQSTPGSTPSPPAA